jgi:hypothetical protein
VATIAHPRSTDVVGLVAVCMMLVFYAIEQRSPWCVLGFAIGWRSRS